MATPVDPHRPRPSSLGPALRLLAAALLLAAGVARLLPGPAPAGATGAGELVVTVRSDADDRAGLAGVTFTVELDGSGRADHAETSGPDGTAPPVSLPPGRYVIRLKEQPRGPQVIVDVGAGARTTAELVVPGEPSWIKVTAFGPVGERVAGALVVVRRSTGQEVGRATTGDDGQTQFGGVRAGRVDVVAESVPSGLAPGAAVTVDVRPGVDEVAVLHLVAAPAPTTTTLAPTTTTTTVPAPSSTTTLPASTSTTTSSTTSTTTPASTVTTAPTSTTTSTVAVLAASTTTTAPASTTTTGPAGTSTTARPAASVVEAPDGVVVLGAAVEVPAPAAAAPRPVAAPAALPRTGTDPGGVAATGVGLVLLGTSLRGARRRGAVR